MIRARVLGFDPAATRLRKLAATLADDTLVGEVVHDALEPVTAVAATNMQRSGGDGPHTADQVTMAQVPSAPGTVIVEIGIPRGTKSRAYIAYFLEFGTRFARAFPWLRPAWDAEGPKVVGRLVAGLRARLFGAFRRAA